MSDRTLKLILSILVAVNTLAMTLGGLWFEWSRRTADAERREAEADRAEQWNYGRKIQVAVDDVRGQQGLPPTSLPGHWSK